MLILHAVFIHFHNKNNNKETIVHTITHVKLYTLEWLSLIRVLRMFKGNSFQKVQIKEVISKPLDLFSYCTRLHTLLEDNTH